MSTAMSTPLLEASGEMSTSLTHLDEVPPLGNRSRYISFDSGKDGKSKRREDWNSWTAKKSERDIRHFNNEELLKIPDTVGEGSPRVTGGAQGGGSSSSLHQMAFYTRKESGTVELDLIDVPSHRSSMTSNATSEGVIEGDSEYMSNDFEQVASSLRYGWSEPSTSKSLDFCKKHNLKHYNNLLRIIGWRKFNNKFGRTPCSLALLNFIFPAFMFVMLVLACAAQLATCFGRDISALPKSIPNDTEYKEIRCEDHLLTTSITTYMFILVAYIGGFYIFRITESEHLSSLTETVFLSFNDASLKKSRKRPALILMTFLISGFGWLVFSFCVSLLRLYALGLDNPKTIIQWFIRRDHNSSDILSLDDLVHHYKVYHYVLVSMAMLGFVFFDLLFVAITINYCSQCQLLKYYVENIIDKVQNKKYKSLDRACKEIYHMYEFLTVLNGKVSFVMTLASLVFLNNVVNSYQNLRVTSSNQKQNIGLGFLNILQWLSITAFPVIVATQFTATAGNLRRLGLQVASRPFFYSDTSNLELQYFLNFTESTRFSAKLAFVPLYPSFVVGVTFVFVLLITLGIIIPQIETVSWF